MSDLTKARVLALKLMATRCAVYAESDAAQSVASPVFTLLWQLLETRDTVGRVKHSYVSVFRQLARS